MKVECKICGNKYYFLGGHIRVHKLTASEYRIKFPGTSLISTELLQKWSKLRKGRVAWNKGLTGEEYLSHYKDGKIWNKDIPCSESTKQKLSLSLKGRKTGRDAWNKDLTKEIDTRVARAAKNMQGRSPWNKDLHGEEHLSHYENGHPRGMLGKHHSIESAAKISKGNTGKIPWNTGLTKYDHPSLMIMAVILSKTQKRIWDNYSSEEREERIRKSAIRRGVKPNKPETYLIELIEKYSLPFQYTGNKVYPSLGGKMPDFVSTNGDKRIIEYDGYGGHNPNHPWVPSNKPELDDQRDEYYRSKGFDVLRLFPDNLQKGDKFVLKKIQSFLGA